MERSIKDFVETRDYSSSLCAPLEVEDYVVQPSEEVSPPKWHLAHTSWFFEKFILEKNRNDYKTFNESYNRLFNSYYKTVGEHWPREKRGALSRPKVSEVLEYRKYIDENVVNFFENKRLSSEEAWSILEIGIHHEKQHQELLLMDIKFILSLDPDKRPYASLPKDFRSVKAQELEEGWLAVPERELDFGAKGGGFSYDNERPRHRKRVGPSLVSSSMVTNKEYLEFIEDGAYARPELWLSLGWDWVRKNRVEAPLYWEKAENGFKEYTLYGLMNLEPDWPVQHVSLFEADAYAKWKGRRLPSEFELEYVSEQYGLDETNSYLHGVNSRGINEELWCWSCDQYTAYPGYTNYDGSLGEYNEKFMCNQFVLRGGCYATPKHHYRPTYRNFYEPWQRWMFSGIRLAETIS